MRLYTHGVDKRGEGGVGTLCAKSQCGGCHIVYGGIVLVAGANMEHGPKSIAPKACLYLFTNCEVNNTNGFRFLPVDMRAVLLLVVIFMRLAAETACNE